jgi:hypothetical protein
MLVPLLRALPVTRAVDHQLIQPAAERRREPELGHIASERDARLLGNVLGVRAMTTPFPGEAVDRVVMQIQQLREGGDIPALRSPYEPRQVWVVHSSSSLTITP